MVVALGPGKFYGSSLPRPRIYTDVKYSSDRVDPPVPVLDPFLSWAEEAHWSMGGLSFQRHRLQGRIEGNVEKLRHQIEKSIKKKQSLSPPQLKKSVLKSLEKSGKIKKKRKVDLSRSPSPPPAPVASNRRRYLGLVDDEDEDGGDGREEVVRKWPVRKLSEDFERVAKTARKSPAKTSDAGIEAEVTSVASRTRSRKADAVVKVEPKKAKKRLRKMGEGEKSGAVSPVSATRSSPRLVKRV